KLENLKAKNYLFQAFDNSILETIVNKDTSKKIWNSMKQKYQESKDTSILSIDELQSSLLVHEQRMSNTVHEEHALKDIFSGNVQLSKKRPTIQKVKRIITCGKKKYFSELDENFSDSVKLGNNSNMVVNGKGNIRLDVNGVISIISGVFYVPELKNNLLSLGQLQEKGLNIINTNNVKLIILRHA
ncbi:hypothetical protein CR513_14226, partial [Mucuna pruriens]